MISHVCKDFLTLLYIIIKSSDFLYDVTPCGSNFIYLNLYGILFPCTNYFHILFYSMILLYLIFHTFSLYLLCGCLISNIEDDISTQVILQGHIYIMKRSMIILCTLVAIVPEVTQN